MKLTVERLQSAVVPYLYVDGQPMIVLVKSKHKGNWGLPKGGIEDHLTKKQSAELEALEEAGCKGKVGKKIGSYRYIKGKTGRPQHVSVYPMQVLKVKKKYLESKWRERGIFSFDKAMELVSKDQKKFIKIVGAML